MFIKAFKYFFTILLTLLIIFRGEALIFAAGVVYDSATNSNTEITYKDSDLYLTSNVIAILGEDIFVGYATGYIDGNGVVEVSSLKDDSIKCVGEYSYVSLELLSGKGTISCSNGLRSEYNFRGLDNSRGYGYGTTSSGAVKFTYGMSPKESQKYLLQTNR